LSCAVRGGPLILTISVGVSCWEIWVPVLIVVCLTELMPEFVAAVAALVPDFLAISSTMGGDLPNTAWHYIWHSCGFFVQCRRCRGSCTE